MDKQCSFPLQCLPSKSWSQISLCQNIILIVFLFDLLTLFKVKTYKSEKSDSSRLILEKCEKVARTNEICFEIISRKCNIFMNCPSLQVPE